MVDLAAYHLAPETSLLVIANMQNEYCKPGGLRYTPNNEACIPAIKTLLGSARERGVPIIFIGSERTQKEAAVTVWHWDRILEEGTWNSQIVDELFPGEVNEFVVKKNSYDPFFRTRLDSVLQELVPKPTEHYAVVTGLPSNLDLWHTLDGFHLRDYWTIMPVDCSAGPDKVHQETLDRWATFGHWNVFASRSDLITFGPAGSISGKVTMPDAPGRTLYPAA